MKTSARPELEEPVLAFAAQLHSGAREIPLAHLASLFGANEELLERVRSRGAIRLDNGEFSNDGPELVVPAGRVELEIPSLMKGRFESGPDSFRLTFPLADYTLRACVTLAFLRKCFELKEMRATAQDLILDFGSEVADRRYTFR